MVASASVSSTSPFTARTTEKTRLCLCGGTTAAVLHRLSIAAERGTMPTRSGSMRGAQTRPAEAATTGMDMAVTIADIAVDL